MGKKNKHRLNKKIKNTVLCDSSSLLALRLIRCSGKKPTYEKIIIKKNKCNNLKVVAMQALFNSPFGCVLRCTKRAKFEGDRQRLLLDGLLHILICHHNQHHESNFFRMHFYKNINRKIKCICLDDALYALSPEVMLCMMAQYLEWSEIMLLALELCGTYSIDANPDGSFVANVAPVTTPKKIKECARQLCKTKYAARGARAVLEVSQYVRAGSASPQESRLYVLLCGPHKHGCYEIDGLEFNQKVHLSGKSRRVAGQGFIKPDLSSRKLKVAIEYDSRQFHSSAVQINKDERRSAALVLKNWKTFSITPDHLGSLDALNEICKEILRAFGLSSTIKVKDFFKKQQFTFLTLQHVLT